MQLSVESKDMVYPVGLLEGHVLPDGDITIWAASDGMALMNMKVNKGKPYVIGKESVRLPSGIISYDKIMLDAETKMRFKITTSVCEYVNMGGRKC